jgi:hypothetical protein
MPAEHYGPAPNKGLDRFDGTHFTKAGITSPENPGGVLALRGAHTVQLFVSTESGAFYYLRDNAFNSYALKGVIHPVDS